VRAPSTEVRFFNVYRTRDGGFTFGKRSFKSMGERSRARDSQRALACVRIEFTDSMLGSSIESRLIS
jgi:hypothetical protein